MQCFQTRRRGRRDRATPHASSRGGAIHAVPVARRQEFELASALLSNSVLALRARSGSSWASSQVRAVGSWIRDAPIKSLPATARANSLRQRAEAAEYAAAKPASVFIRSHQRCTDARRISGTGLEGKVSVRRRSHLTNRHHESTRKRQQHRCHHRTACRPAPPPPCNARESPPVHPRSTAR